MKKKDIFIEQLPLSAISLPSRWWGRDIALFNYKDAIKFIDYCELNSYAILGIEGFHLSAEYIVPDMVAIFDGSSWFRTESIEEFKKSSIKMSKIFLSEFIDSDLEFEFVLIG